MAGAGIQNKINFSQGEKLKPSTAEDILGMQESSTDVSKINYTGDPEGSVSANPSSLCHDPVSGNIYLKESGTGNTGWIQLFGGSWNVNGLSGSKTSGSGSTQTIKSPPYSDLSATGTSVLNSGEFVTGAYTRTLPASAGLADGDLIEFVCISASVLIIQAVGTQKIRLGNTISSASGTATSTAIGDSISLRFRATDGFWYATSSMGNWTIA